MHLVNPTTLLSSLSTHATVNTEGNAIKCVFNALKDAIYFKKEAKTFYSHMLDVDVYPENEPFVMNCF